MTGNITPSYKSKTAEKTLIEEVEDDVYEPPHSYFSKASTRVFDQLDNGKAGHLLPSKFVDLIKTLGEVFHGDELAGNLQKVYPNESGSLDPFDFLRLYADIEVSLDSVEEAEIFVSWVCKITLLNLQQEIFLKVNSLKRERDQERISLKECSYFQTLRKGRISTVKLQQYI